MTVRLLVGDCRELGRDVPDASLDMVFTDPPYLTEYLPLYDWLFAWSARVLKPTGFLMTYAGGYHLDTVMVKARPWLEYYWLYWYMDQGRSAIVWPRLTISQGKTLLCYRLPGYDAMPRTNVLGVWIGSGADKRYHTWGQDESTARYYIDCFTQPGDQVADPFCGGGTTAYVCTVLGRDCWTCDIDPAAVDTTRQRLTTVQPLLWTPEQQLELFA